MTKSVKIQLISCTVYDSDWTIWYTQGGKFALSLFRSKLLFLKSDSLSMLFEKERLQANRSRHALQKSYREWIALVALYKRATRVMHLWFALLLSKNKRLAEKKLYFSDGKGQHFVRTIEKESIEHIEQGIKYINIINYHWNMASRVKQINCFTISRAKSRECSFFL